MWAFFLRIVTAVVLTGISAYLSYRKPEDPEAGTLADLGNPRADEGTELVKPFGTVTIADPQVAWFGNLKTTAIVEVGPRRYGFFGPKSRTTIGFKYFLGVHFVVCLGPVDSLNRIRIDKRIAFVGSSRDGLIEICKKNLFGATKREGGVTGECSVMTGLPDQGANDYLLAQTGTPQPAYRGVLSVVLRQVYIGNAPSLRPWEFRVRRIESVDPGYNGGEQWLPEIAQLFQRTVTATGEQQEIFIAIDSSTSMAGTRITNAKAAIVGLLNSLRSELAASQLATIRIVSWAGSLLDDIQVNDATSAGYDSLIAFVNGITLAGDTNFAPPYEDAAEFFAAGDICKIRRMLFVTDGEPTSDIAPAIASYESFENVSVIGISIDINVTSELAQVTDSAFRVNGGDPIALENALISAFAEYDMNPAHILREVLLSPDTGGSGLDADAGDTWEDVAQVLYDEGFGLSIIWRGGSDRGDFKREIERHIDARAYIDRRTGKWEIKLIRDDYDSETLPVFDTSNVVSWSNINFPEPNTLLNQLAVVWNDPEKDESTSLTISNPARIRMNGSRVIQEKIEYMGIQRSDLAGRVAARDLAARSAPLITGEFVTKYLPTDLNLGSPIVINNPRLGINNRIVRINEIEDGNIRDNATLVRFIEDRFGLSEDNALEIEVPTTTLLFPVPTSPRMVEEAPRYTLIDRFGEANLAEVELADPEVGFVIAAGASPSEISTDTILQIDSGTGYEEIESMAFVPGATTLGAMTARADHVKVVVQSRDDLLEVAAGSLAWLDGEQVIVDLVEAGDASIITEYWYPSIAATLTVFTVTVRRGCLDTVPRLHAGGSSMVFYADDGIAEDTSRTDGDSIGVKMQTVTTRGVLSLVVAPEDTVLFASRALRPYPAGQFKVNGSYAEDQILEAVDLTWVDRNRLTDTGSPPISHDDADVVSEAGVSYQVTGEAFGSGGASISTFIDTNVGSALLYSWDGLAPSLPAGAASVRFAVTSLRAGYESWQAPAISILVGPGARSVEDADEDRVTEDASEDIRTTEE